MSRSWLLALVSCLASGCGPAAAGIILSQSKGSSGGATSNTPPVVSDIGTVSSSVSGIVETSFLVADAQSNPVNVVVEVRTAGSSFRSASPADGSPSVVSLTTTPAGRTYRFDWDSVKDTGPQDQTGVELRLTPFDADAGASETITVDVLNNEPPEARVLRVSSNLANGVGFVDYLLSDSAAHPTSVDVEFSLDGTTFFPATRDPDPVLGQGVTSLATTAVGNVYTFAWDSRTDAPGVRSAGVVMRLRPRDALDGAMVSQGGLEIDNTSPPAITDVAASVIGADVSVDYSVLDAESDPVSVQVEVSVDGGAFVTANNVTPTPITGLGSDPSGVPHSLLWNGSQVGLGTHTVVMRLTPSDTVTGAPAVSAPFLVTIAADQQPDLAFPVIPRQDTDQVTFDLAIFDPEGSDVRLDGFSLDPGSGAFVQSATIVTPALPATVTSTGGAGTTRSVTWNARADLGTSAVENVRLRVEYTDLGTGTSFTEAMSAVLAFTYGNDAPTISNVRLTGQTGNVVVSFDLSDTTADLAAIESAALSLRPEYSVDGGASYSPILAPAIVGGATTDLLTVRPPGVRTTNFTWNTRDPAQADLRAVDTDALFVRLTPIDKEPGTAAVGGPFTITNNSPPDVVVIEPTSNPDVNGAIELTFAVRDAESDPADVILQWSTTVSGFPSVADLVADQALRRRAIADPDLRATRRIISARPSPKFSGRCLVTGTSSADAVVVEDQSPIAPITTAGCVGGLLQLLSGHGGVVQQRNIVGADPAERLLMVDAPFDPAPVANQRLRVLETAARLFFDLATDQSGAVHRVSWDAPQDLGISDGRDTYFIRATGVQGTRDGPSFTTFVSKKVVTDRLAFEARGVGTFISPLALAVVDMNGDGVLDLASTDLNNMQIELFLGVGDGTFTTPTPSTLSIQPSASAFANFIHMVSADFDRDGDADLAVAASTFGAGFGVSVSVFLGAGDGTFALASSVAATSDVTWIAVSDFDEDGAPDLATVDKDTAQVSIFLGNGDGSFSQPTPSTIVAPFLPVVAAAGDLDGDGHSDLVVGSGSSVTVYRGNGDGTFQAGTSVAGSLPFGIELADVNQDGALDVLLCGSAGVSIYHNDRTGALMAPIVLVGGIQVLAVHAADVNGDGLVDILASPGNAQEVTIFLGRGDGTYVQPHLARLALNVSTARGISVADFNGDAVPDVVASSGGVSNGMALFLGLDKANFTQTQLNATGGFPENVSVGDLNGDGRPDAVTTDPTTNLYAVFAGNGDGTFVTPVPIPNATSNIFAGTLLADLDGNGAQDVVTLVGPSGRGFSVFLNNGFGSFTPPTPAGILTAIDDLAVVTDLNNDGNLDLVSSSTSGNRTSIFRGNADGTFMAPIDVLNEEALAAADVNNDGFIDLLARSTSPSRVTALLGNGDGTFTTGTPILSVSRDVDPVDLNNDGRLDLVIPRANDVSVFFGNGDGTFTLGPIQTGLSPVLPTTVADLDLDGLPDVIASVGFGLRVLRGLGDGSFARSSAGPLSASSASTPVAVDVNGDGSLDLVYVDRGLARLVACLNDDQGPIKPAILGVMRVQSPTTGIAAGGALSLSARVRPYRLDTKAGTLDGTRLAAHQGNAFHFSSVSIATGATLVVSGEDPLVLLSQGNVVVDGTIVADGLSALDLGSTPGISAGGSGGRGGPAGGSGGDGGGRVGRGLARGFRGLGPGGGHGGLGTTTASGGGGGHGTPGSDSTSPVVRGGGFYGSLTMDVLFGGSGGGGGSIEDVDTNGRVSRGDNGGAGGGGGGGAVRITAGGNVTLNGTISANGGNGGHGNAGQGGNGGGGSGGSILIQARGNVTIGVSGVLSAVGGQGASGGTAPAGGNGGDGRIRFETPSGAISSSGSVLPGSQSTNVGVLPP